MELLLTLLGTAFLILLPTMMFTVQPKQAATVTRLGRFQSAAMPGLNFKLPWPIDIVDKRLATDLQHGSEVVRVNTADNAYVDMPIQVFLEVDEDSVEMAAYNLRDPLDQIMKLAAKEIRQFAKSLTLDDLFKDKQEMENTVKANLEEFTSKNGFKIGNVVIDAPIPPEEIQSASNKVIASARQLEASRNHAESIRIERVGEAKADAEALRERSKAFADSRTTVATGMSEAALHMRTKLPDLLPGDVMRILEGNDWRDALISCSKGKGTLIIAGDHNSRGIAEVAGLQQGLSHHQAADAHPAAPAKA